MSPGQALALLMLLAACTAGQGGAPTPDAHAYIHDAPGSYLPQYGSASQSWPADLALSCRLPVFATPSGSGFIVFPDRTFVADPASAVAPPTEPSAGGHYSFGISYDKEFTRWLPVWQPWVSPDGRFYAIAYPDSAGVHVYSVNGASDNLLGPGRKWLIVGVESKGVYASEWLESGQGPGLWLLPYSGSPRQITSTGYWFKEGGGAAYGPTTLAPRPGNVVMRLDLASGSSRPWFAAKTAISVVIGFDATGDPLIEDRFTTANGEAAKQIWIVPANGLAHVIANNLPFFFGEPVVADRNGIWLSGDDHVYFFAAGRGTFAASSEGGVVAGGCA